MRARYEKDPDMFSKRFSKAPGEQTARWEHFIVDGGRNTRWRSDENGDGDEIDGVKGAKWWEKLVSIKVTSAAGMSNADVRTS